MNPINSSIKKAIRSGIMLHHMKRICGSAVVMTILVNVISSLATPGYYYQDPRYQDVMPTSGTMVLLNSEIWHPDLMRLCASLCTTTPSCLAFLVSENNCTGLTELMTDRSHRQGTPKEQLRYYEISGPIHNIAFKKPTNESGVYRHLDVYLHAFRSVDGTRIGSNLLTSCFLTIGGDPNFMYVDLEDLYYIGIVKITPRGDCCNERFYAVSVSVGESLSSLHQCELINQVKPIGYVHVISCEKPGRYLHVAGTKDSHGELSVCEIEACGYLLY